ncbi:hypothetical protein L9F63_010231, partial [Diploptera punctata]
NHPFSKMYIVFYTCHNHHNLFHSTCSILNLSLPLISEPTFHICHIISVAISLFATLFQNPPFTFVTNPPFTFVTE